MKQPERSPEVVVKIRSDEDIVEARSKIREIASRLGFSTTELTMIATTVSELARNIIQYAGTGEIAAKTLNSKKGKGIEIIATDHGPGIPDINLALQDGYSTSGSLGIGLPGVKRMMDEFEIYSEVGRGTEVIVKKWHLK